MLRNHRRPVPEPVAQGAVNARRPGGNKTPMRSLFGPALAVLVLSCGGTSDGSPLVPPADAGPKLDAAAKPSALYEQLTISEIAVYQTVKIDVMKGGASIDERNAPIVTAKRGILRVWVDFPKTKTPWRARALDAELRLVNAAGDQVLTDRKTIARASDDDTFDSTFDFAFDEAVLTPDTRFELTVRDPLLVASGGDKLGTLHFPTGIGVTEPLGVSANPGPIKLVIVPVQFQGWLPDTTPVQLERYRTELLDLYPAASVEISVRAPIVATTTDWYQVLTQIAGTRAADAPAPDVYYAGSWEPGASYTDYLKSGSIAGLGTLGGRTSLILGYSGSTSPETLAHELGHNMGRAHAPCGNPAGVDELYPYSGASLGVNGWSTSLQQLVPESESDVMSYCQPTWVSDYTYAALFANIRATYPQHDAVGIAPAERYRRIWIDPKGAMHDGGIVVESPVGGTPTAQGLFFPLDHLPGGYLLVPADRVGTVGSLQLPPTGK